MSFATAMKVNVEARRILAVSISKLYASRSQRGGLRLHRSLLLSMVMRSARDIYHSSRESEQPSEEQPVTEEPMDTNCDPKQQARLTPELAETPADVAPGALDKDEGDCDITEDKENMSPAKQSRKRRGKASAAPDFLPRKRARLEPGEERYAAPLGSCRAGVGDSMGALTLNQGGLVSFYARGSQSVPRRRDSRRRATRTCRAWKTPMRNKKKENKIYRGRKV